MAASRDTSIPYPLPTCAGHRRCCGLLGLGMSELSALQGLANPNAASTLGNLHLLDGWSLPSRQL